MLFKKPFTPVGLGLAPAAVAAQPELLGGSKPPPYQDSLFDPVIKKKPY